MAQREWSAPADGASSSGLWLYNSLIDKKVPFIPAKGRESKSITWYTCGPTVYDSAHMGHARNYVSFDVVRRVMEDYFGYDCLFVMNVTDVDDKIILRARKNHLLSEYASENRSFETVLVDARSAVSDILKLQNEKVDDIRNQISTLEASPQKDQRRSTELASVLEQEELKLKKHRDADEALRSFQGDLQQLLNQYGGYIAETLDISKGKNVTDQSIFRAHAAKYEAEFLRDMKDLGCRLPDAFTRVSEYIPEIVEYIEGILRQGFAYEAGGSVYFDTQTYRTSGHVYGKLKPWAVGSATLAAEGESNFETKEKRHPADFALWKQSKGGEPEWKSPWGMGRPGWHIECSAMASAIIGATLDIHSGGEDLKFPHHDNELAQAEAYFHEQGCRQWVNYFLHSGHLSIEGLKMSKSLKNFITIREALKTFSARQIRLLFVLQQWNRPMAYGESSKEEVKAKESIIKNFFQNVSVAVRDKEPSKMPMRWEKEELELSASFEGCQKAVHAALCDNVDTRIAMEVMLDLIKTVNVYLAKKAEAKETQPHPFLLTRISGYLTHILSTFGVVESPGDGMGLSSVSESRSDGTAYLDAFSTFRDEIRSLARDKAEHKEILAACDRVRDSTLVDLGVRLEDRPDGKSIWKLDDPNVLKAEIEEKKTKAKEQARQKLRNKLELKIKEKERFEKAFELPAKYRRYDSETGYPTHDKDDQPLEGKAADNARKDFDKFLKKRAPMEQKLSENPRCLEELEEEIQQLRQGLESEMDAA